MLRLIIGCAVATIASGASAQTIDGALRVHAETSLAQYAVAREHVGNRQVDIKRVSLGPQTLLGAGFGFGLSESLVVGCALWLGYEVDTFDSGMIGQRYDPATGTYRPDFGPILLDETVWTARLTPYLEWVLGVGRVRPFVGVGIDVTVLSSTREQLVYINADPTTTYFQLGAAPVTGVHVFVADSLALDVSLRGSLAYQTTIDGPDQHGTSIGIAALIGFSGWIR